MYRGEYNKANLPYEALQFAFLSMLKEITLEYYHTKFHGFSLKIMELVQKFQDHFKGQENRQTMLQEWNSINLR
ncbi:putative glycosyl transferase [Golovinomyces cichoracearum]|uniref:Putative glycosyl transferase n=1 Tax=Golovinomyces cichoracearum TaxID=62708 RepID=A0A420HB36_9PEZI|nr:putative glycosyl transferase [Golovinomyces cichoracearum]